MKESFRIDYPRNDAGKKAWNKEYGMNALYEGKHWSFRRKDAQYWHMLTLSAMQRAKVRRKPFEKPVIITFWWNDRLDLSNHAYMAKLIEDGMKGSLINDDSKRWVKGIEHFFHDENYILVELEEVSG